MDMFLKILGGMTLTGMIIVALFCLFVIVLNNIGGGLK